MVQREARERHAQEARQDGKCATHSQCVQVVENDNAKWNQQAGYPGAWILLAIVIGIVVMIFVLTKKDKQV